MSRNEAGLLEDISRLEHLKSDLMAEATQLRKMMFANEELKLFTQNTCPYCLKEVQRVPHRCVCGNEVSEVDYEKFFYDSAEYLTILKSRQKNVQTIDTAIVSISQDLQQLRREKEKAHAAAQRLEEQIRNAVEESDSKIDLRQFEEVEGQLSEVRTMIARIQQQRELIQRREMLENELSIAVRDCESSRYKLEQLGAAAQADMQSKRVMFSDIYDEMMRKTLPNCHSASIDDRYMPVVNGGQYTEASAAVPRRLLYYATMLQMSLLDESVKFPRFLLIDTPETSGIDTDNLRSAISRVVEVVALGRELGRECQVILTTGLDKRPVGSDESVFGIMAKKDRLLISTGSGNDPFQVEIPFF